MFNYLRKFVAILLFITGIVLIMVGLYNFGKRYYPKNVDPSSINPSMDGEAYAIVLSFPRAGISQPVIYGGRNGTDWETTDIGVTYYKDSAFPGEMGNSVFYGHNWPSILGKLSRVKEGDEATIYLSSGDTVNYKVIWVKEVPAGSFDIIERTDKATLTVYTCTGFMDSRRLVVTSVLEGQDVSFAF